MKKLISAVFAIVLIVIAVFWFSGDDLNHIEDTNGASNYSLQTITDENIRNLDIGALNIVKHDNLIGETVTYQSDCFTGVYELFRENIVTNHFEITINHAQVNAGNFKMVLCIDDEIVHTFALNELTQTFILEDVAGTVSLRIAGESADFMFDYFVY